MALARAGVWQPAEPEATPEGPRTFHEFASAYLQSRRGEVAENTYKDYERRLVCHLLPFFAGMKMSDIDIPAVDRYRQHKVVEREQLKALQASGEIILDSRGQ